jgi:hypothetical protein
MVAKYNKKNVMDKYGWMSLESWKENLLTKLSSQRW